MPYILDIIYQYPRDIQFNILFSYPIRRELLHMPLLQTNKFATNYFVHKIIYRFKFSRPIPDSYSFALHSVTQICICPCSLLKKVSEANKKKDLGVSQLFLRTPFSAFYIPHHQASQTLCLNENVRLAYLSKPNYCKYCMQLKALSGKDCVYQNCLKLASRLLEFLCYR